MIFETKRLIVRKLEMRDLGSFYKLQSNPKVLQFADGEVKTLEDNNIELENLIENYKKTNNDFWIYAVDDKNLQTFVGTVALVKDDNDDEIGYRFLEEYWGRGYGFEVCSGLIAYAKKIGLPKLVGYVVVQNVASLKIIEKAGFREVKSFMNSENKKEIKYELVL